jgi:NAD-dependent dihydropyrimidine dehydrogenase PreA subunit
MGELIYLANVVTLELDAEKCIGCGMCLQVCPRAVWSLFQGRAAIDNKDACIECGACTMNCPAEAIQVQVGVGCAAAVINSFLGRESSSCCCTIENRDVKYGRQPTSKKRSSCC